MKASQIDSHGATEPLRAIAASNGVKKLGPKEGRTIEVGGTRLTWKARGRDWEFQIIFQRVLMLVISTSDTDVSKPSTVCCESRQQNRTKLQNSQNVFKAVLREKYLFYETRIYLS